MLFTKKLIILSALGGGITFPIVQSTSYSEPDPKFLEYDSITKRWERLLEKIPKTELKEKLALLFSKNLTTFAKSAMENTVKQLLTKWVMEIWEYPDLYFPISYKLQKFFSEYHVNYWAVKNDLDELSWELVKSFFTDFFFKEKGWLFLSEYGDFREFTLKEWIDQEKPMELYEWNINYYSSGESKEKIYTPETLKNRKSQDSYLWPEFSENSQYFDFISKFKHLNEIDINLFNKKIWTISDLKKVEDGRKLGVLLNILSFIYSKNKTDSDEISVLDFKTSDPALMQDSRAENPLYLFLERKKEKEKYSQPEDISNFANQNDCFLLHNSIFAKDFSKKISNYDKSLPDYHFYSSQTHSCLYGIRELKNGWNYSEKLFASREKSGVSLYYLPNISFNYKIDELSPEISEKVVKYLKDNFESIFFKYLKNKGSSNKSFNLQFQKSSSLGKWDFATHFEKYKDLLNTASEYLDSLYWMKNVYEFQKILAQTYINLPKKIKLKKLSNSNGNGSSEGEKEYKVQLASTEGLFSPLPFNRSVDTSSEEREIQIKASSADSSQQETNDQRKNDGFYSNLFNFFIQDKKFFSLAEKAQKLREELNKNISTSSLKDLFSNDLFLRAQLEKIVENKEMSQSSLFTIWAEEVLTSDSNTNQKDGDFNQIIAYLSSTMKGTGNTNNGNGSKELIEKTLFLEPHSNLPLHEQSIFGAHKQELTSLASTQQQNGNISSLEKNKTLKAKNTWILKNYFLSDSAYESSSEDFQNFLSYLYSLHWLTKNNYSNLGNLINHIFKKNKNKNAYLVWLQELNSDEIKSVFDQNGQKDAASNDNEKLSKKFESKLSTDILNPLLMGQTTIKIKNGTEEINEKEIKFDSKNVLFKTKGYSTKNGKNKEIDLAGFSGLTTLSFSSREIPQDLKNFIFEKFWKTNDSKKNTNYSSGEQQKPESNETSLEGIFFEDNYLNELKDNSELKEFLSSFKSKSKLIKYFDTNDPIRPFHPLLKALSSGSQVEEDKEELEDLSLDKLKEKISIFLKSEQKNVQVQAPNADEKKNEGLYKMWNRFSGYLYTGNQEQYPFILKLKEGGETKNYAAFLFQVNQFDFEKENLQKLKEKISEDTFHNMLSLLASNKEVKDWVYKKGLTSRLGIS